MAKNFCTAACGSKDDSGGPSMLINPRRMRSEGYGSWVGLSVCVCVCVLTSFIHPTNDTTYLTGNEGQNICAVFSENAPLQS